MPQVLLHIGPHKAASSHIQESLFKIASLLGDHNYFWPPHSVNSKSVQNYARALRNDRVNAENHETELTVMRKFIDECRQLNRSIILSTEEFDDLRPEHISVLRNDLRGFNVTVVFVYRELLSQLVSLHFEENRFEHRTATRRCAGWKRQSTTNFMYVKSTWHNPPTSNPRRAHCRAWAPPAS